MKSPILLLGFVVLVLASCSTAYRSGQTPDDVYFSPARERDAYAKVEQQQQQTTPSRYQNYDDDYISSDDRWLRMRVRNRARWSAFDDYDSYSYGYNTWNMHNPYSYSYNNYFNNYWSWNSWYNPYCPKVVVVSPKTNPTAYNKVRSFSLNSYTNNNYNNNRTTNVKPASKVILRPTYNSNQSSNQSSNSGSLGNSIRKVFSNQGNDNYSNNNSSSRPSRTYTPPSTSSNNSSNNSSRSSSSPSGSTGSSSSGSSGGGGVSRPTRGGN